MIQGIGVDVVSVGRIRRILAAHGERFLDHLFTADEAAWCMARTDPAIHLAARFAAKEAAFKALSALGLPLSWKDVSIRRGEDGRPEIELSERMAGPLAGIRLHVSLTHDGPMAAAVVAAERP
jgi:holo-[acyl-carrier protein] synthase